MTVPTSDHIDAARLLADDDDSLISGHAGGTGGDKPMAMLLMCWYVPLDGFDPPDLMPLDADEAEDTAHDFMEMVNEQRRLNHGPFSDLEMAGIPGPQWVSVRTIRLIAAAPSLAATVVELQAENARLQLLLGAKSTEAALIWMDENARLRDALTEIHRHAVGCAHSQNGAVKSIRDIARAALAAPPAEAR